MTESCNVAQILIHLNKYDQNKNYVYKHCDIIMYWTSPFPIFGMGHGYVNSHNKHDKRMIRSSHSFGTFCHCDTARRSLYVTHPGKIDIRDLPTLHGLMLMNIWRYITTIWIYIKNHACGGHSIHLHYRYEGGYFGLFIFKL